jgi:hypothetical protein
MEAHVGEDAPLVEIKMNVRNGEWERKECAELEKSTGMVVNKSKYRSSPNGDVSIYNCLP